MDISCQRCHPHTLDQTVNEIQVYLEKGYKRSALADKYSSALCTGCHGSEAEVAQRTQNYLINGEVHNPHDAHAGVTATSTMGGQSSTAPITIECYHCHSMHGESAGTDYCFSCHHSQNFDPCDSCHNESSSGQKTGF